jgi:hypothetical protein
VEEATAAREEGRYNRYSQQPLLPCTAVRRDDMFGRRVLALGDISIISSDVSGSAQQLQTLADEVHTQLILCTHSHFVYAEVYDTVWCCACCCVTGRSQRFIYRSV